MHDMQFLMDMNTMTFKRIGLNVYQSLFQKRTIYKFWIYQHLEQTNTCHIERIRPKTSSLSLFLVQHTGYTLRPWTSCFLPLLVSHAGVTVLVRHCENTK